ncbi:diaminopimelate epimerase [Streptosporangium sp. NBC_01495]|uniref:diaminopimelate epimerase n=1 Tax=Streptosporangium sp. NBC_01495 TaxID=2903899 RepID=UPI002E306BB6|nr:diaminopimelate epimerase [Streptosporangium sp. NBC_01495]
MRFRKVHGAGNDFILLTGTIADLDKDWSHTARRLCARHTGIGADGLVISAPLNGDLSDLGVTCWNADGSVATMCANALRCAAWYVAQDLGLSTMEIRLVMAGVEHQAQVAGAEVWVTAQVGPVEPRRLQVVLDGRPVWFDGVWTGTEHVVAVVPDVDDIDAEQWGRLVRRHPDLAPLGSNVNFVQCVGGDQALKIRTYERGVEAETMSCGSGAVAAVVIATWRGLVADKEVVVHNRSGMPLTVRPDAQSRGKTYWVGGLVTPTYEGVVIS